MKNKALEDVSFFPHQKPEKLIVLLHGYGDNADNFINMANIINLPEWKINFFALNAPSLIPDYPLGRQWFNLYPNNIYISKAGPKEIEITKEEIARANKQIKNAILEKCKLFNLNFEDCFVLGFSQGAMIAFEFGKYLEKKLAGIGLISGRILDKNLIKNNFLLKIPIFISHGDQDEILPIENFFSSCSFLEKHNYNFEKHLLYNDTHTISPKAIDLLQKFIKKNL